MSAGALRDGDLVLEMGIGKAMCEFAHGHMERTEYVNLSLPRSKTLVYAMAARRGMRVLCGGGQAASTGTEVPGTRIW